MPVYTQSHLVLIATIWGGFPGDQVVKNLPAMQETQVWYLGREDPSEEGMATHSRTLA